LIPPDADSTPIPVIAEVCARSGVDVVVVEANQPGTAAARGRCESSLERGVARGKIEPSDAAAAIDRLAWTTDYGELADRQLVIEAIVEDREAKIAVFRRLADVIDGGEAILASNTSSIPIVELGAAAGGRASQVLGLHFFNPVPVLPLVEVIPSLLTSEDTAERARRFVAGQLGKDTIVAPDRAGFTVNALLIPYLLSAIRMFEQGLRAPRTSTRAWSRGVRIPWDHSRCLI
jgi:3-hydroxybutyryl-CoA dehydrogenase